MGKVLGILGVIVAAILATIVINYYSYYNKGVGFEAGIKAAYTNNQNKLGMFSLKVTETAKVTGKFSEDLARVTKEALQGRYGENGSQAAMQWITENYPGQLDSTLYVKLQQIIESGRTEFERSQTAFIDKLQLYEISRKELWSGFWLRTAGFPTAEFVEADYKVVISRHAKESFETGIDEGVKF